MAPNLNVGGVDITFEGGDWNRAVLQTPQCGPDATDAGSVLFRYNDASGKKKWQPTQEALDALNDETLASIMGVLNDNHPTGPKPEYLPTYELIGLKGSNFPYERYSDRATWDYLLDEIGFVEVSLTESESRSGEPEGIQAEYTLGVPNLRLRYYCEYKMTWKEGRWERDLNNPTFTFTLGNTKNSADSVSIKTNEEEDYGLGWVVWAVEQLRARIKSAEPESFTG